VGAAASFYHLARLRRRLAWPAPKLEELRRRKLAALLHYCYKRIPYYRELFDRIGARPEDFAGPEDLVRFPLLDKQTLRDRRDEFVDPAADRREWIEYRSSGSTGIPLTLWYTRAERLRMGHTVTRELLFNGLKPWHRLVNVTEPRHAAPKNRWYHRLGLMRERFLSVYDDYGANLAALRALRPHALIGFPSVLLLTGRRMLDDGGPILRPRLLFTLAEVLTGEDRRALAQQWGVEPLDLYGANEVGHIAFQCSRRRGYHLNLDSLHVEVLAGDRPAGPGERGEVVVTSFDLRVMPILRYRVGDVAQWLDEPCDCGCRLPLLGGVAGRSDGFIAGAGGELFSALEIALLLKPVLGIGQYRLVQERPGQVRVEFTAAGRETSPEAEIHRRLAQRLGAATEISLVRLESLPREQSGKIRMVVSSVPSPFRRRDK